MIDRASIGQRFTGRHHFICEAAGDLSGEVILDIGCGPGWFEGWAVESGCERIVGLEVAPYLVERVSEAVPEAQILLRDARGELSDLGLFTVVCVFDFVEHLGRGEDVVFLRKLADMLEPGGRLLISVPHKSLISNALDPAWYIFHRHFSVEAIEELLCRAGLRVRRMEFGGGIWEQVSMIWLYVFKWIFSREMPFADFLEERRFREYENFKSRPTLNASVTMFVEAFRDPR